MQQGLLELGHDNVHCISAVSREGLQQLVWQVQARLDSIPEQVPTVAVSLRSASKLSCNHDRVDLIGPVPAVLLMPAVSVNLCRGHCLPVYVLIAAQHCV